MVVGVHGVEEVVRETFRPHRADPVDSTVASVVDHLISPGEDQIEEEEAEVVSVPDQAAGMVRTRTTSLDRCHPTTTRRREKSTTVLLLTSRVEAEVAVVALGRHVAAGEVSAVSVILMVVTIEEAAAEDSVLVVVVLATGVRINRHRRVADSVGLAVSTTGQRKTRPSTTRIRSATK